MTGTRFLSGAIAFKTALGLIYSPIQLLLGFLFPGFQGSVSEAEDSLLYATAAVALKILCYVVNAILFASECGLTNQPTKVKVKGKVVPVLN
jgi:hypothetical protein